MPFESYTFTVLPASAVPVTVVPEPAAVGADGAVASTVTEVEEDSLPTASVAVTVIEAPSLCVVVSVIV